MLEGAAAASVIAAFLGLVGSAVGTGINWFSTNKTNAENKDTHQQDLDYNAAMTQTAWEREDTAHQREVADLEAAGLSPLANTTGTQVTSPLSASSPIAAQAPQVDATSMINSVLQAASIGETHRHNREVEGHADTELELKSQEIANKARELDIEDKKVDETIRYQTELTKNLVETLQESKEHNDAEEDLRRVEYESEMYFKEIKQQIPEGAKYYDIYDIDIYRSHLKLWVTQFDHFMDSIGATQKATAKSESNSGNVGVNGGAGVPGVANANIGVSGGASHAESTYEMENLDFKQKKMLEKFYAEHPIPVYHMKKWNVDYAYR